jgi:hypothetical protein
LNGNATSLIKDYILSKKTRHLPFAYAASPKYLSLDEYPDSASMFNNVNSADCGGFTACKVLPKGCTGTYSGRA